MDHTEAVDSQAVEKYVLREMTEKEALAFEQHFFTCKECADDVTAESVFVDTARDVFADTKPKASEAERRAFLRGAVRGLSSPFSRGRLRSRALRRCWLLLPCIRDMFLIPVAAKRGPASAVVRLSPERKC